MLLIFSDSPDEITLIIIEARNRAQSSFMMSHIRDFAPVRSPLSNGLLDPATSLLISIVSNAKAGITKNTLMINKPVKILKVLLI